MKWKIRQFLLKVAIGILAFYLATTTIYNTFQTPPEPIRVIHQEDVIKSDHYIISEEFVLGKLQSKSQIVSFEQELKNISFTHVDEGFTGKRHTELTLHGTYKMGLETAHIKIKHIDENGIVYIELPEPIIISLELPYDQIDFNKTKGWLRLAMSEEEEKNFYKAAETSIRQDIINNEETLRQANIFNEAAVRDIVEMLPTVRGVVFE